MTFTSSSGNDRQQQHLSPSMDYLEKCDIVFEEDKITKKNEAMLAQVEHLEDLLKTKNSKS